MLLPVLLEGEPQSGVIWSEIFQQSPETRRKGYEQGPDSATATGLDARSLPAVRRRVGAVPGLREARRRAGCCQVRLQILPVQLTIVCECFKNWAMAFADRGELHGFARYSHRF
jgi:hypothetical protein